MQHMRIKNQNKNRQHLKSQVTNRTFLNLNRRFVDTFYGKQKQENLEAKDARISIQQVAAPATTQMKLRRRNTRYSSSDQADDRTSKMSVDEVSDNSSMTKLSAGNVFPNTELPSSNYRTKQAWQSKISTQTVKEKNPQNTLRCADSLSRRSQATVKDRRNPMTVKLRGKLDKLVKKCETVVSQNADFLDELMLCQLVGDIKQKEDQRLCKQLQDIEDTKPSFLRERLHEKHIQRVTKTNMRREVREDHKNGISDPGRMAAKSEKRMFFGEHIKTDAHGRKKHVVC